MKTLMVSLLLMLAVSASSQTVEYEREDSIRVMALLNDAYSVNAGEGRGIGDWVVHFGRAIKDMGVPYVGHTLEPFDKERLIVNLRQMDCTTFTENAVTLSLCMKNGLKSFEAFCHILQKIRYQNGDVPCYTRRLHYFTSWILDNTEMGFCHEIQSPNPPFTGLQSIMVDYMSKNPSKYRMLTVNPEDIPAIRLMENDICGKQFRYIPKQEIKNTTSLRQAVHNGDILAIITNIKGLDTQHIGIAVWHDDGLHLLNASSIHKKVVEEPMTLRQYLYKHPTMPGIRVVRLND